MRRLAERIGVETPGDALVLALAATHGLLSIAGTAHAVAWLLG